MNKRHARRWARRLATVAGVAALTVAPEFVPSPAPGGGYSRLEDLVAELRASGREGWELVALAQERVHGQFLRRSYRQPWRSPEAAFAARAGFCTQYNLALCRVLRELGFEARPVFAARVRADSAPWWRMSHVWVRVRHDGRTKACCARHSSAPGEVDFVPASEVLRFGRRTCRNTTAVTMLVSGVVQWKALLLRRPLPRWMDTSF